MARKCARTFSIVVEKGKKSILDVTHLLPDALPRSVRKCPSWRGLTLTTSIKTRSFHTQAHDATTAAARYLC